MLLLLAIFLTIRLGCCGVNLPTLPLALANLFGTPDPHPLNDAQRTQQLVALHCAAHVPENIARRLQQRLFGPGGASLADDDWPKYAAQKQRWVHRQPGDRLFHDRRAFRRAYADAFCAHLPPYRTLGYRGAGRTAVRRTALLRVREDDLLCGLWARRRDVPVPGRRRPAVRGWRELEAAWDLERFRARFREAWAQVARMEPRSGERGQLHRFVGREDYRASWTAPDLSEAQQSLLARALQKRLKYRALDERFGPGATRGWTWVRSCRRLRGVRECKSAEICCRTTFTVLRSHPPAFGPYGGQDSA